MSLVTQAEYARTAGVTRQAVSKAVKAGRIKTKGGKIDPDQADRDWKANSRESMPPASTSSPGATSPGIPSYADSRAIREAFNARLARLDFEERNGKLLRRDEVERAMFEEAREDRNRIMLVLERMRPHLSPDQFKMLNREIRDALESRGPNRLAAASSA